VSREQREALDELLRDGPLDLGGDVSQQRAIFDEMMAAIPVPADVTASPGSLGGIPVVEVTVSGADPGEGHPVPLARRAGARLVSVDYRLAAEHPHPAAVEDAVAAHAGLLDGEAAPSAIALAGESAGARVAARLYEGGRVVNGVGVGLWLGARR
jgi:monoterpene epsilon-lactone hydrolase